MRAHVFCVRCGGARTIAAHMPETAGCMVACFRCGGLLFTVDRRQAPRWGEDWFITASDLTFLRSMRIAPGDVMYRGAS